MGDVMGRVIQDPFFARDLALELDARQKGAGVQWLKSIVRAIGRWLEKLEGVLRWMDRNAPGELQNARAFTSALFEDFEVKRAQLVKILADYVEQYGDVTDRSGWKDGRAPFTVKGSESDASAVRGESGIPSDRRAYSLADRDRTLAGVTSQSFTDAVDKRIKQKTTEGVYREKDAEAIKAASVSFFTEFSRKEIPVSTGGVVYFMPDIRSAERLGYDNADRWAEYCIHQVTSQGKTLANDVRMRVFDSAKTLALSQIEGVIRSEKAVPSRDGIAFLGDIAGKTRLEVFTKLDKDDNLFADLSEVSFGIRKAKDKKNPPHKPLTEVVDEVARSRAAGYSPSTDKNVQQGDSFSTPDSKNNFSPDGATVSDTQYALSNSLNALQDIAEIVSVDIPDVDLKNTAAVRSYLMERYRDMEVRIESDGRLTVLKRSGLQDTLKRRGEHRKTLGSLDTLIQKSYPVGYETVDERHREKKPNIRGQFVYAAPFELPESNGTYMAILKFDDTSTDNRAQFKDISIQKMPPLYAGQMGLSPNGDLPADGNAISIEVVVSFARAQFKDSSLFSEIVPGGVNSGNGTQYALSPVSQDALLEGPDAIRGIFRNATSLDFVNAVGRWGYQMAREMADAYPGGRLAEDMKALDRWIESGETNLKKGTPEYQLWKEERYTEAFYRYIVDGKAAKGVSLPFEDLKKMLLALRDASASDGSNTADGEMPNEVPLRDAFASDGCNTADGEMTSEPTKRLGEGSPGAGEVASLLDALRWGRPVPGVTLPCGHRTPGYRHPRCARMMASLRDAQPRPSGTRLPRTASIPPMGKSRMECLR